MCPGATELSDDKQVAGYIRVSTEKQKEQDSHVRQKELLEEWIEENIEFDNVRFYEDIAISGQANQREAYEELMDNLDEIDYVIVRELSRFGRDLKKVLNDFDVLEEYDVEFIEIRGGIDTTTPQGKLQQHIRASFNQYWSDLARERTLEMIERRREKGDPIGRPKKLNDEQIDQVIDWRNKGISYGDIATLVEDEFMENGQSISTKTIYRYCQRNKEN